MGARLHGGGLELPSMNAPTIYPDPSVRCKLAGVAVSTTPPRKALGKRPARPGEERVTLYCACGVISAPFSFPFGEVPNKIALARLVKKCHWPSMLYAPALHVFPENIKTWQEKQGNAKRASRARNTSRAPSVRSSRAAAATVTSRSRAGARARSSVAKGAARKRSPRRT